jgi:hypothetical protein
MNVQNVTNPAIPVSDSGWINVLCVTSDPREYRSFGA